MIPAWRALAIKDRPSHREQSHIAEFGQWSTIISCRDSGGEGLMMEHVGNAGDGVKIPGEADSGAWWWSLAMVVMKCVAGGQRAPSIP